MPTIVRLNINVSKKPARLLDENIGHKVYDHSKYITNEFTLVFGNVGVSIRVIQTLNQ
jgi:hypothetical protein